MEIFDALEGTAVPWLLGTFLALSILALFGATKSWSEMKRSPYFFQRLQAGKRLQGYLSTSTVLFMIALLISAYAWRAPVDNTHRVAILVNNKPAKEDVQELLSKAPPTEEPVVVPEVANADGLTAQEVMENTVSSDTQLVSSNGLAGVELALPAEYDRFEATAELNDSTELGALNFSTEVTDDYQAVDPGEIFPEGYYTLYATFSYEGMVDGMVWSWIWRRDGQVVEGGNEMWAYGDEGPGYIYLAPEEGFLPGQYSLEVWVNDELLAFSSVVMNDSAVSAGN